MFKNIIILIILAVIIYALTYSYKQSKLELSPNMVTLKVGTKDFNFPYTEKKKESQNFSNVKIKQYSLKSGEEKMFFPDLRQPQP